MRILALVTDAFGGTGGIAQYNRDFLTALADAANVEIVVLARNAQEKVNGSMKVLQLKPIHNRFLYAFKSLFLCFQRKFDFIFCGHLYMSPLAGLLSKLFRIPVWLQLHGIESWDCPSKCVLQSAEKSHLITCVSRYTRNKFLSWANVEPHCVHVLPNTVHARFIASAARSEKWIQQLGVRGKRVMLTVGRLSKQERYKGHEQIIRLMPRLRAKFPDLVYLIAGDGDDRERLEAIAKRENASSSVIFTGYVPDESMPEIYHLADVFVLPSKGEGFGISYLEALACGVPVLGLDCAGTRDALQDGELGCLSHEDDLYANLELLLQQAKQPAKKVHEVFGFEKFSHQVKSILNSVKSENEGDYSSC